MRVVHRKRLQRADEKKRVFTYDLCLITEEEDESLALDLLGDTVVDDDGLLVRGTFELRLSDGYGDHYVLLKGEKEHVERL
jgi:hypothetical protein